MVTCDTLRIFQEFITTTSVQTLKNGQVAVHLPGQYRNILTLCTVTNIIVRPYFPLFIPVGL